MIESAKSKSKSKLVSVFATIYDYILLPIYVYFGRSEFAETPLNKRQNFVSTLLEMLLFSGMCYLIYSLYMGSIGSIQINHNMIDDYVSVKTPSIMMGSIALIMAVWVFDIVTPGSWLRDVSKTKHGPTAVLVAIILAMGLIMSR